MSISIDLIPLLQCAGTPASQHALLSNTHRVQALPTVKTTDNIAALSARTEIKSISRLITTMYARQSFIMHTTSASPASSASSAPRMAPKAAGYAASSLSESTTYSYDKPTQETSKPRRSFRQRVKTVLKELGTSPFEGEDDKHKQSAGWLTSLPPSKI